MDKLLSEELQEKLKKAFDETRTIELQSYEAGFLYHYIQTIKEQEQETLSKYIDLKTEKGHK